MQELKSVYNKEELLNNAVELLKKLIEIPSFSKDEFNTSVEIENFFKNIRSRPSVLKIISGR
jgi:acetylornithine deacetylase